jgi:hypothetical protein
VLAGMKEDFGRARTFEVAMRTALREELARRGAEITADPVPARRFVKLLGAVAICDQAVKLLGRPGEGPKSPSRE